jgi:hypothetical protein
MTGAEPPIATASTKQYHAATPLGGLPCGKPRTGSISAQCHVPTAVPINSNHVVTLTLRVSKEFKQKLIYQSQAVDLTLTDYIKALVERDSAV